ncbi:MAG: ATP-binding protein [Kofleriaceae bacterium]|nr:ATP-binding protein [Kofleriaceae bacterium]
MHERSAAHAPQGVVKRRLAWGLGCAVGIVGFAVGAELTAQSHVWADVGWIVVDALATWMCFRAARRVRMRHLRIAWWCLTAAMVFWTAAMLVWAYHELVRGVLTPFPSLTDVLSWLGTPLFLAGVFFYRDRESSRTLSIKQLADLFLITCALVVAAAELLYEPAQSAKFSTTYIASAIASPILGIACVVFGLSSLAQHLGNARRKIMALLMFGAFLLAAVSILYSVALLAGSYGAGSWLDVIWVIAFLAFATAAREELLLPPDADRAPSERISRFDPLVPVLSLLTWMTAVVLGSHLSELVAVQAITGIGVLVALSLRIWATQRLERLLTERIAREQVRAWELEARLARAHKLEAVGTLAGGVAHDFNNVLAAATGGLRLVRRKLARGVSVDADLDEIEAVLWRASDLTSRLLDLARKREPRRVPLDPYRAIARTHALLEKVLPPGVRLELGAPNSLPAILADAGGLEHALLNLGLNARDALRARGGTITMSAHRRTDHPDLPGEVVVFEVSDDGPGIEDRHLPHLFEPFFTTKAENEGTGLGLAMVEAFAIANAGVVAVRSTLGHGSTFELVFEAIADVPTGEPLPVLSGVVLVVAGEDPHGLLATDALERCGLTALVVRDTTSALAEVQRRTVRAIVVDAAIGLTDGEAVRTLRAAGLSMPIVLVTSAEADVLGEWAAVVRKPIDPNVMADRMRDVLSAPAAS